jgi:orotidine-5'-phosphate decarboxylase
MRQGNIAPKDRIIFALDVPDTGTAQDWVARLRGRVGLFKVGLQLFLDGGLDLVDRIAGKGHGVMLDLKFHDIPETVRLAVSQLRDRGVTFTTVHAEDGVIRGATSVENGPDILAVTVLTSMSEEDLRAMGITMGVEELVLHRARRAVSHGCRGVVCSAREAGRLRRELGPSPLIVTPGIRPGGENAGDDQKRVATARKAIADGADYVVVGRPIRDAAKPLAVVETLTEEIRLGLEEAGRGA